MKCNKQVYGQYTAEELKGAAVTNTNTLKPHEQVTNTASGLCATTSTVTASELPPSTMRRDSRLQPAVGSYHLNIWKAVGDSSSSFSTERFAGIVCILQGVVTKGGLLYQLTHCNLIHRVHPPLHLQRIHITCSERNRLLTAYHTQKAPLLFSHHAGRPKLVSHDL